MFRNIERLSGTGYGNEASSGPDGCDNNGYRARVASRVVTVSLLPKTVASVMVTAPTQAPGAAPPLELSSTAYRRDHGAESFWRSIRKRGRAIRTTARRRTGLAGAAVLGLGTGILFQGAVSNGLHGAPGNGGWLLDGILFVMIAILIRAILFGHAARRHAADEIERYIGEERAARLLASHDPLTGLLNRRGLETVAERPPAANIVRVLILADLDDFKSVNDTFGHAKGDEILMQFSARLGRLGNGIDTVHAARLGGDEFVVVAYLPIGDHGDDLGRRIAADINPEPSDGSCISIGVSAGSTPWPGGLSLEAALKQADVAMYDAKQGCSGFSRYDVKSHNSLPRAVRGRRLFEKQCAVLIDQGRQLCVMALSIDRHPSAQRAFGYGFAARLLRAARERIGEHELTLCVERIGPATLAVLFHADDMQEALAVTNTLNMLGTAPYMLDGHNVEASMTIGMAGPAAPDQLRQIAEQAQLALDDAHRSGRSQVIFDQQQQYRAARNRTLMNDLNDAIVTDGLELHYQPKMSARSSEIDSFEALVRWSHPLRGAISPGEFVPLAEDSGAIKALTYWVLDRALTDWTRLETARLARPIYVNISAQLVGDAAFAQRLLEMLQGRHERIGIEITETAVLDNPEQALANLRMIADAGISIAIDDYGVGLSSLSYLKRLPATELKIDMMFITDLAESHRDPMIVRSTIDLAHGLGLRVTAEGVDKPESLALLKIMGCDLVQGYQISPALALPKLIEFMQNHDSSTVEVAECAAQLWTLFCS